MCKYQLTNCCPQSSAMKVPVIRNGPKGISLFKLLPFKNINVNPIIAPKKNAKNRATRIFGQPSKRPIKIASFTSPKPIALPFDIKNIAKKNPDPTTIAKTQSDNKEKSTANSIVSKILKIKVTAIAGNKTLSGIM